MDTRPTLRAVIILSQSNPSVKYEVFERLNTGGVGLNPQEIRNSALQSPFNDMLHQLAASDQFRRLLGIADISKSPMYDKMGDVEFVLRYFTYRDHDRRMPRGSYRKAMDGYMKAGITMTPEELDEHREDFQATLGVVDACFGEFAFRRWKADSQDWGNQRLGALYDAEMFACRQVRNIVDIDEDRSTILERLKDLFAVDEFERSVRAGTNNPRRLLTRVQMVRDVLADVLER